MNSVAWAPHEYGLILGCASADGYVSILKHMPDDSWEMTPLEDGKLGCNSISWAPVTSIVSNLMPNNGLPPMKFVTGSCDNNVRLWEQRPDGSWPTEAKKLPAKHEDWVRDVAWAPALGFGAARGDLVVVPHGDLRREDLGEHARRQVHRRAARHRVDQLQVQAAAPAERLVGAVDLLLLVAEHEPVETDADEVHHYCERV